MIPLIESRSITPDTLGLLFFVKINSQGSEYVRNILREYLIEFKVPDTDYFLYEVYEAQNLIHFIKTGRKALEYRVRLTDLGEDILKSLSQKPLHELSEEAVNFLWSEYERVGQKEKLKNRTKTQFWISEFLYHKESYNLGMIKAVIKTYVDSFEYEKRKFMLTTQNLFFKAPNAFATRWSVENCPIIEFIDKNQNEIRKNYKR